MRKDSGGRGVAGDLMGKKLLDVAEGCGETEEAVGEKDMLRF